MAKNDKTTNKIDETHILFFFVTKILQKKEATTCVIASFSVFYGYLDPDIDG